MTTDEIKKTARDKLMFAMYDAFAPGDTDKDVYLAMVEEFKRVEEFLGYENGGWK